MNKAELINTLGKVPGVSRALRWSANRYADGSTVRIKSGLAQGMLWQRHHRYVNGYWTGQYEYPMQKALARDLKPGSVFYDVGANAGFFSIVAAKLVGPDGAVVSFDPDPDNCDSIRAQIRHNGLESNWQARQVAVGAEPGTLRFARAKPGSPMGQLVAANDARGHKADTDEEFDVDVTTLDDAIQQHRAPDVIKMDIEGAEIMAMNGAAKLLAEVRPVWLIELHGPECEREVVRQLTEHDYEFVAIDGSPRLEGAELDGRHVFARPRG